MQEQLILNQTISDGLDVIGDRWTILILRSAFYGVRRFDALQKATGASRSTLTRRLNALLEHEIFFKQSYSPSGKRFEYLFTEKGLELLGPSLLAAKWESDWKTADYMDINGRLFHHTCENRMLPKAICQACQEELKFEDVRWPLLDEHLDTQLEEIRTYSTQNRKRIPVQVEDEKGNYNLASLIGDRWTLLVLIAAFFGTQRYDSFLNRLNIPPSVLAERLKQLVANDIFQRLEYQHNPPRHNYVLTKKGQALFPFVMSLRQWVSNNLEASREASPLTHSTCGKPLTIDIVCDHCAKIPLPSNLEYFAPS